MSVELAEPLRRDPSHEHLARFETLYRRYRPALVSTCAGLTGSRAAAEDIAQETLLRAYQHLDWLDVTRAWPWLKTVATRLAIDDARKFGRVRSLDDEDGSVGEPIGGEDDLELGEERVVLAEALSRLPSRQRMAVGLRYVADFDSDEAAAALRLDRSAFKQLLFRGRRRLQSEYRKLTAAVPGIVALPVLLLRRGRHLVTRVKHALSAPRLRSLLHPMLELGVALLVIGTLAMHAPLGGSHAGSGGSSALPFAAQTKATTLHPSGPATFPGSWNWSALFPGTWFGPATKGPGGTVPTPCVTQRGGESVGDALSSVDETAPGVVPLIASADSAAKSAGVCGGTDGSSTLPSGSPGSGLTVTMGGILVPVQTAASQASDDVDAALKSLIKGGPMTIALPQLPDVESAHAPEDSSSDASAKGDSAKDGSANHDG
jgi:RNA polymerase sigma-70 factor (ECF subfamily)